MITGLPQKRVLSKSPKIPSFLLQCIRKLLYNLDLPANSSKWHMHHLIARYDVWFSCSILWNKKFWNWDRHKHCIRKHPHLELSVVCFSDTFESKIVGFQYHSQSLCDASHPQSKMVEPVTSSALNYIEAHVRDQMGKYTHVPHCIGLNTELDKKRVTILHMALLCQIRLIILFYSGTNS